MEKQYVVEDNIILFRFVDPIENGFFTAETKSGIYMKVNKADQGIARWCKVLDISEETSKEHNIKKDDFIFLPALHWSFGFTLDDVKMWRALPKDVVCMFKASDVNEADMRSRK